MSETITISTRRLVDCPSAVALSPIGRVCRTAAEIRAGSKPAQHVAPDRCGPRGGQLPVGRIPGGRDGPRVGVPLDGHVVGQRHQRRHHQVEIPMPAGCNVACRLRQHRVVQMVSTRPRPSNRKAILSPHPWRHHHLDLFAHPSSSPTVCFGRSPFGDVDRLLDLGGRRADLDVVEHTVPPSIGVSPVPGADGNDLGRTAVAELVAKLSESFLNFSMSVRPTANSTRNSAIIRSTCRRTG